MTDDVKNLIPEELKAKIAEVGFHKVAAQFLGLKEISGETLAGHIGTKLASRMVERRKIMAGLRALAELSK